MKTPFYRTILIIAVIISGFILSPSYAETIQLDESLKKVPICPSSEYLEDHDGALTFEDIRDKTNEGRWVSTNKQTLGFGFIDSAYWLRFTVRNKTDQQFDFFIEQAYPLIDNIRLYVPDGKQYRMIEVGDKKPFAERPYEHKNFVFPLQLKAKITATFYMRFKTESSMNILLSIWSPDIFRKSSSTEYRLLMIFYGIFLIMLVYNLIIFFFIRRIEYLFYVVFTLFFLLFVMALNGTAYQFLWPNSPGWANFCIPFLLQLSVINGQLFCIEIAELRTVRKDIPYRERIYKLALFFLALGLIQLLAIIFLKYRLAMVSASIFSAVYLSGIAIIGIILIIKEKNRPLIMALAAGGAVIAGGIAYTLKTFAILPSNFFTEWSLHIGFVIMITIFSIALADRINTMRKNIQEAEKKYRNLVESSSNIIFSLDENNNFVSVNSKIRSHLGHKVEDVIGKCFLDFIHERWSKKQHIARRIVQEFIHELKRTKNSVSFRTDFRSRFSHEPKEMTVTLELVDTEGEKGIILGKASEVSDDVIIQYLESEKHIYNFENYLNNAEIISQRLTKNLNKYLGPADVSNIRIALREMMINAIEHGNLNINFEEKTQAMFDDKYLVFVEQRQKDPHNSEKKVHIEYFLSTNSVEYHIKDEGDGFNHTEYLNPTENKQNMELALAHGRGITMAKHSFDKVDYNEKGNEVSLVKYF